MYVYTCRSGVGMKKLPEIKYHKAHKDYYLYLDRRYTYLSKTPEEAERRRRILLSDFLLADVPQDAIMVADLCARFLETHEDSTSFYHYRRACKHLLETHGTALISNFGPNALRQTREAVVRSGNVSRQYANKITRACSHHSA